MALVGAENNSEAQEHRCLAYYRMCLKVQYYILCDKSCPEKERRYCIFDQFVKGFEAQNNHENIYIRVLIFFLSSTIKNIRSEKCENYYPLKNPRKYCVNEKCKIALLAIAKCVKGYCVIGQRKCVETQTAHKWYFPCSH